MRAEGARALAGLRSEDGPLSIRSETKGLAGACPDRTRAIPCMVRAVTAEVSMIRNMRGMTLGSPLRGGSFARALPGGSPTDAAAAAHGVPATGRYRSPP